MTAKDLDRLEKLLCLALDNPNEHEARSAAMQVCRLLREHKVLMKALVETPAPRQPANPSPSDLNRDIADFIRDMNRRAAEAQAAYKARHGGAPQEEQQRAYNPYNIYTRTFDDW